MCKVLRIVASTLLAITLIWWLLSGANTGWTKTSIATMQSDEITGIDYPTWEKRFVPGVDFIAAGATISLLLLCSSFLPLLKQTKEP